MPLEFKSNSSLRFIVAVAAVLILMLAFAARAQKTLEATVDHASQITVDAAVIAQVAPIFRGPAVYDSGGGLAWKVAVADLNGDGKPDLVVANPGSGNGSLVGSVGVLLGKGHGDFYPAVVYDSGGGPTGIAIGDLNGDGKPDLVTAMAGCLGVVGDCLGVLLGKGDGTFQPVVIYPAGGRSWGSGPGISMPIMIADVNGDHKPDLVVVSQTDTNYGDGRVGVLLGNGDGTFRPVVTYDTGGFGAFSGALVDVNGDKKVDLVVVNCTGSGSTDCLNGEGVVGVLLGNGDGTLQSARAFGTGGVGGFSPPLVVHDMRGDGKADILVGNYCAKNDCSANPGSLALLLGNGDGTFRAPITYVVERSAVEAIAVADLNGDGKLDIAAGGGFIRILLGNGDGRFESGASINEGEGQLFAVDLNHDKKVDLVWIQGTVNIARIALGNGDGTFQEAQTYKLGGSQISWATVADVDGDGKPDLVSANWCCRPFLYEEGTVGRLLNISEDATTTTFSSSLNPSFYGQKVTWTAKVKSPGLIAPTGKVAFKSSMFDRPVTIGIAALDANGFATLTRSNLNAGYSYPITAVYSGDVFNSSSISAILPQVVNQTTSVATITSSANPSRPGQAVTFTARIGSPTVTPSGPVTFAAGTTLLGSAQLSGGKALFTISTLPVGTNSIRVTFLGNSNIARSTAFLTQTVQ